MQISSDPRRSDVRAGGGRLPAGLFRTVAITALVGIALIIGASRYAGYLEQAQRDQTTADASAAVLTDADTWAAVLERRFLLFDVLHGLSHAVAAGKLEQHSGPALKAAIDEIDANLARPIAQVRQVGLMDAAGILMWTSADAFPPPTSLADRQHYLAIARNNERAFISAPVVGRITQTRTVQYARGIYDGARRLAAVSVVSVDPATLTMRPNDQGGDSVVSIYNRQGDLIHSTAAAGADPVLTPTMLGSVPALGRARLSVVSDRGTVHYVALRRATELGLVVAVSTDAAAGLAGVAADAAQMRFRLGAMTGVAIVVLLLGLILLAQLRAAQGAAREREAAERGLGQLTELAENLQDMVVLWEEEDSLRRLTYVSPSSTNLLGISPEALYADPELLRYHPDDVGRVRERMMVLRRGEEEIPAEQYRLMRADGTPIWMEVVANLVAGSRASGGVQRFVACFRDVSARRAAEQGMADANRRLESVLNNSPAVLYELELRLLPDGSYEVLRQFVSRSAARSSDFTIEELERPGFIASRSSPNFKELRQHSIRVALDEGRATIEYPFREKSGAERHMRDTCTLTSHEGDRVVLTGFSLDVTEEASLRDQLLETSKLSFLGEMAAGIAHELHQPLTAINLQAEILAIEVPEGSPGKAAVDRRVEKITALVERAGAVIRRIRAFSRRNTEPAAPFDPSAAIEDGLAIIEGRVTESEVKITRDYPAVAVAVQGHQAPFEQVIMNLVTNAIDAYGPPGSEPASSRQIGIRVAPMGPVIEITVADRAGGIPAEIMSRLFEPFFTTKGVGVGTGLGLSISYRIVSDMGGHIRAVNRDGGAIFTVTLPAHTPAAVA